MLDLDALEQSRKQITPANMQRVAELYGDGAVIPLRDLEALIAELRASRKVVEAARAVFDGIYNEAIGSDEVFSREMALKDALTELSSINVKGDSE